ncbi:MAG: DUF975 family protein [Lachnospiraceae bacterium]|nr:DUF975 family protein [Lachnospiraceae bacterium]
MYSKIKEIKAYAREQLLSHMWTAVFFTFLYIILTNLCTCCLMVYPGGGSIAEFMVYEFTTLLIDLFAGLLQAGVACFYLNVSTGKSRASLYDLFYAFTHSPDKALKVTLMLSLAHMVCTLPYVIYTLFFMPSYTMEEFMNMPPEIMQSMGIAYFILGAGELVYFLICLYFEPVYFMLADMPSLTATKAMKMSIWLMKGSKVRLLGLKLSFLPLQFISLLTFGIGNLWLIPYMNTASAYFYTDLSAKRLNQQK